MFERIRFTVREGEGEEGRKGKRERENDRIRDEDGETIKIKTKTGNTTVMVRDTGDSKEEEDGETMEKR